MVTLKSGLLLDLKLARKLLGYSFEDLHTQFRTDDLAAPEKHHDFGLVTALYKAVYVLYLQFKVVFVYLRPHLDLLYVYCSSLGMFFIELVFIFAEIKYFAYGRRGIWRHLNQIQVPLGRMAKGLLDRHDTELLSLGIDYSYFSGPYLLVHPYAFTDISSAYVCTSIEFIFS